MSIYLSVSIRDTCVLQRILSSCRHSGACTEKAFYLHVTHNLGRQQWDPKDMCGYELQVGNHWCNVRTIICFLRLSNSMHYIPHLFLFLTHATNTVRKKISFMWHIFGFNFNLGFSTNINLSGIEIQWKYCISEIQYIVLTKSHIQDLF